jgi:hypothetical protein
MDSMEGSSMIDAARIKKARGWALGLFTVLFGAMGALVSLYGAPECVFRPKPSSDSDPWRAPIPVEAEHLFRLMSSTDSGPCRAPERRTG